MASKCKSCDKAIIWAVNEKTGQRIPLDADPVPHLYSIDNPKAHTAAAKPAKVYQSHFLSCPQATSWSRSSKS